MKWAKYLYHKVLQLNMDNEKQLTYVCKLYSGLL